MSLLKRLKATQPLVLVMILTVALHIWAVSLLPQDFDEPVYLQNAFDYASAFRSGNFNAVIDYAGTLEHPPLEKIIYAGAILALGKAATWTTAFFASRAISAFFGVLAVLFIGLAVDPLAAGMLAVNTLAVKYTSQVYLEAVPLAMTVAAVLAFLRTGKDSPGRWFWVSAVSLGIAAASKYSYLPVILVVLGFLAIFDKKVKFHWLLLYAFLSLSVFFALDVRLWHDPINRLIQSLTFHIQYSQGQHVEEVGYPWFQPFIWIFTSPAGTWHPNVFFYFGFDGLISILAVLGIKREWKERRWLVVWLAAGIIFLLLWPTKWPQYTLTVIPALCMMGARSLRWAINWARTQDTYWGYLQEMLPKPGKWLWIAIAAFVFFIAAVYLSAAVKLAVGRVGWSRVTQANSFLPGNTINALLPLADGSILIGTQNGAAAWAPPTSADDSPHWTVFDRENSGLVDNNVLSLAVDRFSNTWFGTASGLSMYSGASWTSYRAADLGLPGETVISLAASPDGRVYAGTLSGAAVWNGVRWSPVEAMEGQTVFALSITAGGQIVWFGTETGVERLDVPDGTWSDYPIEAPVKDLLFDSSDTLWAATSGAGLARWDGSNWTYFSNNNSGIPFNTVNWVAEVQPGILWVGTSMSANVGGAVVRFDGTAWQSFLTNNSGASGAEVTVIALQNDQVWIGTRTAGIDLFNLGRQK